MAIFTNAVRRGKIIEASGHSARYDLTIMVATASMAHHKSSGQRWMPLLHLLHPLWRKFRRKTYVEKIHICQLAHPLLKRVDGVQFVVVLLRRIERYLPFSFIKENLDLSEMSRGPV